MSQTMSQSIESNMPQQTEINEWREKSNPNEWREKYEHKIDWKKLKEANDAKDEKTCEELKHLFHISMELGFLPSLKKREKMMNYLNTKGNPRWTDTYIWCLADSNKIDWVKGSSDPTSYETYKAEMNYALANILRYE